MQKRQHGNFSPLARDEVLLTSLLRDHHISRQNPLEKASGSSNNVSLLTEPRHIPGCDVD